MRVESIRKRFRKQRIHDTPPHGEYSSQERQLSFSIHFIRRKDLWAMCA